MHLRILISFGLATTGITATQQHHNPASTTKARDMLSTPAPDAAQVAALLERRATANVSECRSSIEALRSALPIPPPELVRLILEQGFGNSKESGSRSACTLTLPEQPWSKTFGSWWANRTSYRAMSLTKMAEIADKCGGRRGRVGGNRTTTEIMATTSAATTTTTTTEEPCAGTTTVLYDAGSSDGTGPTKTETYVVAAAVSGGMEEENAAPGRVQGPAADGVAISALVLVVAFWLCM